MSKFSPGTFHIATANGPEPKEGFVYRGVGLDKRGRSWPLTHLNTGHQIVTLSGGSETVFALAERIAECGEWDFIGLKGWVNMDPDIPAKVSAIMAANPRNVHHKSTPATRPDADIARAVSEVAAVTDLSPERPTSWPKRPFQQRKP